MYKLLLAGLLAGFFCCFSSTPVQGQFLKKAKQKISKGKNILKGTEAKEEKEKEAERYGSPSSSRQRHARQTKSGGLKMTPPDVMDNIESAESEVKQKNLSETRYAIQEAMKGVELEIGHKILNSFPEYLSELSYEEDKDEIQTTGIGFVGLNIGRRYFGDDREASVVINNNSMLISSVNAYMTGSMYGSSQSDDEQHKRVKVQGNKALIQYSDYDGYKLNVPLGQSTLFLLHCINFASEDEVMAAANEFDLAEIKRLLGEN